MSCFAIWSPGEVNGQPSLLGENGKSLSKSRLCPSQWQITTHLYSAYSKPELYAQQYLFVGIIIIRNEVVVNECYFCFLLMKVSLNVVSAEKAILYIYISDILITTV